VIGQQDFWTKVIILIFSFTLMKTSVIKIFYIGNVIDTDKSKAAGPESDLPGYKQCLYINKERISNNNTE
jgi:hypothetical protein